MVAAVSDPVTARPGRWSEKQRLFGSQSPAHPLGRTAPRSGGSPQQACSQILRGEADASALARGAWETSQGLVVSQSICPPIHWSAEHLSAERPRSQARALAGSSRAGRACPRPPCLPCSNLTAFTPDLALAGERCARTFFPWTVQEQKEVGGSKMLRRGKSAPLKNHT